VDEKVDVKIHPDRWYEVDAVAKHWKVSRDWVIRRIKQGLIKAMVLPHKVNTRKRVFLSRRILGAEILRVEREHTA
jgi:hypothetical protein